MYNFKKDLIANSDKTHVNKNNSYENPTQLQDIEELKQTGMAKKFCPYFYQKEME